MFRSARLKLTLFYLAILLGFSLVFTLSVRILAEHEYGRANDVQRGEVKHLFVHLPFQDDSGAQVQPQQPPYKMFNSIQDDQAAAVRAHLNRDLALINLAALVIGGLVSYWFADRTLKPIEEAHDAQKRFAADASHELRTPLAAMKVENEVFLRQPSFTEQEARDQIKSNLEEVQRLETLANNLLALTNYGKSALQLHSVGVETVIKEAVAHMQAAADTKHVTFKLKLVGGAVHAHYESLVQLVDILLDNAIKYGPENGVITIVGHHQAGQYVLQVIDQGPGVAAADVPRIFDRLYRGDKARSGKSGYGLGLALAKQIADANRATITTHNKPKSGACFEVRLEALKS